jgi:excisionase family DNA binding protein
MTLSAAQGAAAKRPSRYVMIDSASRSRGDTPRRLVRTVEEASVLLGISRAHGYRLINRGELRHIRLGRRILVPDRAIDDLLAGADGALVHRD